MGWRPGDPSSLLANQSVEIASSRFRTCLKDKMGTVKMHNIYLCLHSAHTSELQHTRACAHVHTHIHTCTYIHALTHAYRKEGKGEGGRKEGKKKRKEQKEKEKGTLMGFLASFLAFLTKQRLRGLGNMTCSQTKLVLTRCCLVTLLGEGTDCDS